jgi:hypothetical protein
VATTRRPVEVSIRLLDRACDSPAAYISAGVRRGDSNRDACLETFPIAPFSLLTHLPEDVLEARVDLLHLAHAADANPAEVSVPVKMPLAEELDIP